MTKRPLIILTGPTAVGKTELSIQLAKAVGGEIISADSMQVYRHMNIGSAKIRKEEMDGVVHHLIDELEPSEPFHVVRFQQMARAAMEEIYSRGHIPVVAGGTGFYIQALLYDIDFEDTCEDEAYRDELEQLAEKEGAETLHRMLQDVDPKSAEEIHYNNIKRVIRALEYHHLTGRLISAHNEEQRKKESPYDFYYFVLNRNRALLYRKIDQRVDMMMEQGLLEEVTGLKKMGYDRSYVSMQGIGYKELLAYLDGEMTLEEAVDTIKKGTRHFAKRQITWFKRERDVIWLDMDRLSAQDALNEITGRLKNCAAENEIGDNRL